MITTETLLFLIAIVIGLTVSGFYVKFLMTYARKSYKKGGERLWPFWTYLYGGVLSLPLVLISKLASNFAGVSLDRPLETEIWTMISFAAGIPFLLFHIFGGTLFLPILLSAVVRENSTSRNANLTT